MVHGVSNVIVAATITRFLTFIPEKIFVMDWTFGRAVVCSKLCLVVLTCYYLCSEI
jgi:hypothetical protein